MKKILGVTLLLVSSYAMASSCYSLRGYEQQACLQQEEMIRLQQQQLMVQSNAAMAQRNQGCSHYNATSGRCW